MCGIAGFLDPRATAFGDTMEVITAKMAATLKHRGPDDCGVWSDANSGIALGHQRLSIIDLSASGHQPMESCDGRYVLVYNGEVYNHGELRDGLSDRGVTFRGHSDTEVLLEAVACWGVEETVRRCSGMFALAIWDRQERRLTLVRDRLGIKPLYYGWCKGIFLFGSELKALRAHPSFEASIDRDALALFLQHSYVPSPYTIYAGISKLPPGHTLRLSAGSDPATAQPVPYWSLKEVAEAGLRDPFRGSPDEALDRFDDLLRAAVHPRMEADVPVGAFLSGGVDSTAVVALMQAEGTSRVRTFTIGFHESSYNEAEYARAVAEHLGTQHVEYYVTPSEARDVIPRMPTLYDEPFADSSQIPTYLVSRITRDHVTVSLSGDGGDELFCGYDRYALARKVWGRVGWLPWPARRATARMLRAIAPGRSWGTLGRKMRTLSNLLDYPTARHIYAHVHTHWKRPCDVVVDGRLPTTEFYVPESWPSEASLAEALMYIDAVTYLPDDILTKVDRASMGVSLEARVPLLDHRVVEFAWTLPLSFKVAEGQSKWLLRRLVDRYVPRKLMERPKTGFGVPLDSWLRGPLRPWAEELLSEQRLRDDGFFRPGPIREKWTRHLSGREDWHYYLWDILMFQAWLDADR